MKSFQEFQEMASMVKKLTKQPSLRTRQPSASRPQPINRTNQHAQDRELKTTERQRKEAHAKTTTNRERAAGPSTKYYEVYDPEIQGRSQITQTGDGGRKQPKKDTSDRRKPGQSQRMKAAGGGKMTPVGSYKDRKDIGSTKARSEREQQPTQARGSAADTQKAAAKEERRRAARARIAARKSGGEVKSTTTSSKDAEKKADELLKTKKAAPKKTEPAKPRKKYAHADGGGMTRQERDSTRNRATGQSRKEAKSQMRAEFEKKHGRKPNKKEAMQMTAKAHAAAKALS
jgi:hypothetical protein